MPAQWKRLAEATRVKPGSKVDLAKDFDPGRHDKQLRKDHGAAVLADAKAALLAMNGLVAFVEEHQAANAIAALKQRLAASASARVLRDGRGPRSLAIRLSLFAVDLAP